MTFYKHWVLVFVLEAAFGPVYYADLPCFQGCAAGQRADRKWPHVPRLHVALGDVPLPLPQRRLGRGHHSRRRHALRQAARQVPEGSEEGEQRG